MAQEVYLVLLVITVSFVDTCRGGNSITFGHFWMVEFFELNVLQQSSNYQARNNEKIPR